MSETRTGSRLQRMARKRDGRTENPNSHYGLSSIGIPKSIMITLLLNSIATRLRDGVISILGMISLVFGGWLFAIEFI